MPLKRNYTPTADSNFFWFWCISFVFPWYSVDYFDTINVLNASKHKQERPTTHFLSPSVKIMSVSSGLRRSLFLRPCQRISAVLPPFALKSCQKQSITTTINVDKATIDVAVTGQSHKGVVLDIDGVFLRGGVPLPRAVEALQLLVANHIPFVFVTNGGGITEASKSKELTKKLEVKISEDQVILSHTPFKEIASAYKNDRVLVLGKEECLQVAASYGFTKAVSARQLHEEVQFPTRLYPFLPTASHSHHFCPCSHPRFFLFLFFDSIC